ncbi:MAG: hypothetical protein JEZ03_06535 [Bacteroidales bacterium]|nr:hypothetical protein [Bacteroidales bacterium]
MQTDSINHAPKGARTYELKNHLGNVLATVSDRKYSNGTNYTADYKSATDYYAFGMQMPGRTFSANGYRFGFNGMEKDDELMGLETLTQQNSGSMIVVWVEDGMLILSQILLLVNILAFPVIRFCIVTLLEIL